ncbi:acyl-CoA dehydrogenase family protein [Niveispirillum sp. KHB5.9]|uniref:acyl-CoA dehydrogenase family protein n=1 Tax=Niveispirillum sp. KHB5.9 TaxID=3400269 RepID=UPI003A8B80C0
MDFNDTTDEAEFRAEVRAFLDAHAPRKSAEARTYRSRELNDDDVRRSKEWQATKAAAGFAGIHWPKKHGGRDGTQMQAAIFAAEEERYVVPPSVFNQGVGMALPTIMAHGSDALIDRYARPALYGEEVWCQLFSEPSAGSDLAGLRTRAVRDGDDWVINGQKVWTSNAHFSQYGMLVARTDPTLPKHAGLTFFILDMAAPGIEIRRLKQISGTANFCEVFLTDVRIPDHHRLGGVGEGWKVALTMLANERFTVGKAEGPDVEDIMALARTLTIDGRPALDDPAVRERIARWYVQSEGLKYTRLRTQTAFSRGRAPGPENSIGKLVSATKLQEIAAFGIELLGQSGAVMDPDVAPLNAWFQEALLYAPGKRIAGGTDEILRNIIAERVLKMPGEMRADKDVPFNRIPTSRR